MEIASEIGTNKMCTNDDKIQINKPNPPGPIKSNPVAISNFHNDVTKFADEKPFCRLCYDTKYDDSTLIEPCSCKGTMAKVHVQCLEKWLNHIRSKKCELCLFEFKTEEKLHYGLFQSIGIWTRNNRRHQCLMHDFYLFLMMNVIALSMIGLLLQVIHHVINDDYIRETLPIWYIAALCFATGLWITIYILIIGIFISSHIQPWFVWWRSVKKINLIVK